MAESGVCLGLRRVDAAILGGRQLCEEFDKSMEGEHGNQA